MILLKFSIDSSYYRAFKFKIFSNLILKVTFKFGERSLSFSCDLNSYHSFSWWFIDSGGLRSAHTISIVFGYNITLFRCGYQLMNNVRHIMFQSFCFRIKLIPGEQVSIYPIHFRQNTNFKIFLKFSKTWKTATTGNFCANFRWRVGFNIFLIIWADKFFFENFHINWCHQLMSSINVITLYIFQIFWTSTKNIPIAYNKNFCKL